MDDGLAEETESDGAGGGNVRVMTDGGVTPNVSPCGSRTPEQRPVVPWRGWRTCRSSPAASSSLSTGVPSTQRRRPPRRAGLRERRVRQRRPDHAVPAGWVRAPAIAGATNDTAYQTYSVDLETLLPTASAPPSFAVRFSTRDGSTVGAPTSSGSTTSVSSRPTGASCGRASTLGSMAPSQLLQITFEAETTTVLPLGR